MPSRIAPWLAVAAVLLLGGTPAAAQARPVPKGFFGVVPQGALSDRDLDRMEGAVGTLRVPLYWSESEPRPGAYDFSRFDAVLAAASERHIRVLPFVYGSPAWVARTHAHPPLASARARGQWTSFLRRLVTRYGPGGEFWQGRKARLPIRTWQIWNEPNFRLFWQPRPSPRRYAELLRLSARAIRGADLGARIALAGVAPVGAGFLPWVFLRQLYRAPAVKRSFDLAAVHPYATTVPRMEEQVWIARRVMAEAGDERTPLLISEIGVASSGSIPSAFVRGDLGQAAFLRGALDLLLDKRRAWRIAGVDWFTWQDTAQPDMHCAFCQGAGLIDLDGRPKPAWRAFRQMSLSVR
jgi:Beta-galactosidase